MAGKESRGSKAGVPPATEEIPSDPPPKSPSQTSSGIFRFVTTPPAQVREPTTLAADAEPMVRNRKASRHVKFGTSDVHRNNSAGTSEGLWRRSVAPSNNTPLYEVRRGSQRSTPKRQKSIEVKEVPEGQQVVGDKSWRAGEQLTPKQISAFREVFDLYDKSGEGSINAKKLQTTLAAFGIFEHEEEILDVMKLVDENGNGVIDFEEFLNMMKNTELFLKTFAAKQSTSDQKHHVPRERGSVLFDALTEFMKKSALKDAHVIVGYYARTFRKSTCHKNKGAHVVGHYADGARLIGLTERQLLLQLKRLTLTQHYEHDADKLSPYAKPLRLSTPHTVMVRGRKCGKNPAKKSEKRKSEKEMPLDGGNSQDAEGEQPKEVKEGGEVQEDVVLVRKAGWLSQRLITYNADVSMPKQCRQVRIDRLPSLRKNMEKAKARFIKGVNEKKIQHSICHYREIEARGIDSPALNKQFLQVFSAYTSAETSNKTVVSISKLRNLGSRD